MSDFYDALSTAERINVLHTEAEDLADIAKNTDDPVEAARLRRQATGLVRRAARLRQEEDE